MVKKKIILYPYKLYSSSAKALAERLNTKRVKPDGKYKHFSNHLILNWGCTTTPLWYDENKVELWLNDPLSVDMAANKLNTYQIISEDVPMPEYTTNPQDVLDSLGADYKLEWLARTKLKGHTGDGIKLIYGGVEYGVEGEEFPIAPLYTKYIKKKDEYRVHVFGDKVIDVAQKKKRIAAEKADYQVRNHSTGWVYCREGVDVPDHVKGWCVDSVALLGLTFGAVDVIYNQHYDAWYILEINTAPGLYGTTLEKYLQEVKDYVAAY